MAIVVYGRVLVNKAELIDALAVRLGEKKSATVALDAVLAEIQAVVTKGDKVSITGFGVFEKRTRAARMARNPRTGEAVKVKKTAVPAFRAGAGFKEMVAAGKAPKAAAAAKKATPVKKAAVKTAAVKATAKAAPAKKTAVKKASPASATAKKTTAAAKKTTARKTAPAKTAPAKKAVVKKAAAKTTVAARKTTATKAVAKKAPAKTVAKKAPARKAAR